MQGRNAEEPGASRPSGIERSWFATRHGATVSTALLVVVSLVLLFGNLGGVGIWEPWEASEIQVAQQYQTREAFVPDADDPTRPGYNWAVPTYNGEPVARPLLKTWLIGTSLTLAGDVDDPPRLGALERAARMPIAIAALLLVLLGYLWMRRYYGEWTALVTGLATASVPAVYLGARLATSEMIFMATSSAALFAFANLVFAGRGATGDGSDERDEGSAATSKKKLLWGGLLGAALGLSFLDARLLGLYLPLGVMSAFAVTQLPYLEALRARKPEADREPPYLGTLEKALAGGLLAAALATIVWGWARTGDAAPEGALFLPHVFQWMSVLVPAFVIAAGFALARRTDAVQSLRGAPGVLAALLAAAPVVAVAVAYGDANPVLLEDGEVLGKVPVLTYLLENHLFQPGMSGEHMYFALWMRQVGFSMLPWVALVPLALGYLARATRLEDEDGAAIDDLLDPQTAIKRLLLVWAFVAFVFVALASVHNHYFYPAYFPLMAGVGLMLTDARFWQASRLRPYLLGAMGFTAVTVIMMLGKDLERYPARLVEIYVQLQNEFELPESFTYGSTLKALKYATMLLLATYFGGLVSWAVLTWRDVRKVPQALKNWRARRALTAPDSAKTDPVDYTAAALVRAEAREAYRSGTGPIERLAGFVERPGGYSLIVVAAFVVFAGVVSFSLLPSLSHHLSQRGVYETYQRHGQDHELVRYQVPASERSVYLDGTPVVAAQREFLDRFAGEERFFAVIPRDRLAAINSEVRSTHRKNLHVLDARSSRLLLVSNQLLPGEEDHNFVSAAIVEDEAEIEHRVQFGEADAAAIFDKQIEFLGYSLDRPTDAEGIATYRWGETMRLTTYFRVLRRVPGTQKIFLHIDYPGNRIHGDHDPVNGEFATNYWLPGDIVKDEYEVPIDRYSSVGVYSMNFGFYRGSQRMKVEPREAHDGQNRVTIGRIRVEAF